MFRRVLYYQNLIKPEDNEITRRVVCIQKEIGVNGYFYHQVEADKHFLKINESDISSKSKSSRQEFAHKKINHAAYNYLQNLANTHSKTQSDAYGM